MISRGMAAWMAAWSSCVAAGDREPRAVAALNKGIREGPSRPYAMPEGLPEQVVRLLTEMAWGVATGGLLI